MDLFPNTPPLQLGRGLLAITATTLDELTQLHLATCASFAERNVNALGGLLKAKGIGDFIQDQRRQLEALQADREQFLGSASAIIRRAVKQANELWTNPPQPPSIIARRSESPPVIPAPAAAPSETPSSGEPAFELFEDQAGEHRFRLLGPDGAELLTSQAYRTRKSAANGVQVVRRNAVNERRYHRMETDSGRPMFNLKAGNHQVIATSLPHPSREAMEAALAQVMTHSATARIGDPY